MGVVNRSSIFDWTVHLIHLFFFCLKQSKAFPVLQPCTHKHTHTRQTRFWRRHKSSLHARARIGEHLPLSISNLNKRNTLFEAFYASPYGAQVYIQCIWRHDPKLYKMFHIISSYVIIQNGCPCHDHFDFSKLFWRRSTEMSVRCVIKTETLLEKAVINSTFMRCQAVTRTPGNTQFMFHSP